MTLHARKFVLLGLLAVAIVPQARAEDETIIEFKDVEVGKAMPSWTAKDVVFEPAGKLTRSKAASRIMFFPHLMTEKKGILSAMAAEAIPVQIRFPSGASKVTLAMWGSISSAALVEALDKDGKVVDKASLEKVPSRASPAEPIPSFELTVKAPQISSVRFSGAQPGGYLAAEEVRFTPLGADPLQSAHR
jgi:hypothetical protein